MLREEQYPVCSFLCTDVDITQTVCVANEVPATTSKFSGCNSPAHPEPRIQVLGTSQLHVAGQPEEC